MLSGGPPRELVGALAAGDAARLQAVPGIGKRTAERIIVELREKVGVDEQAGVRSGTPIAGPRAGGPGARGRWPATGCSSSATAPQEAEELLRGRRGRRAPRS